MLVRILPGEYLFDERGLHILNDSGFAKLATEEVEVEITDETQLSLIAAYQQLVRPQPVVENEQPQPAPQEEGEETNG